MSSTCGQFFVKYLLCIITFIFFVLGTIMLGIGIWLVIDSDSFVALLKLVHNENYEDLLPTQLTYYLALAMIACGVLMFLISFLGYMAAIQESRCMLTFYAFLLIVIVIGQVTLGALAFVYQDPINTKFEELLTTTVAKYEGGNSTDSVTQMWNVVMRERQCCGVRTYKDFDKSEAWRRNKAGKELPDACCKRHLDSTTGAMVPVDTECPKKPTQENSNFKQGCLEALAHWINSQHQWIVIASLVVVSIEVFMIFLACCLWSTIHTYDDSDL